MKTIQKIITLFIANRKAKTIREISKSISADYKITHTAVERLISRGIVEKEIVGKSSLCSLNPNYFGPEIYIAENSRKEKILKSSNINQLCREIFSKIDTSFFVFLLFGSYAKNKQTKLSDIDIMFISNEKDFETKISNIISLIPLKIHALIFTEEEFIRMKDSKKSNVVKEAIENNIILYGIETYYKIKNA